MRLNMNWQFNLSKRGSNSAPSALCSGVRGTWWSWTDWDTDYFWEVYYWGWCGHDDGDAGNDLDKEGDDDFRSAPNWNELRKGADLAMLLVNYKITVLWNDTQQSTMANVTPREHFKVKDYERGSNICGNNRWNSVRFSPHLIFLSHAFLCVIKMTSMRYRGKILSSLMMMKIAGNKWTHGRNCEKRLCSWLLQVPMSWNIVLL